MTPEPPTEGTGTGTGPVAARLARLSPAQRAALSARLAASQGARPLLPRPGSRERLPLGMDQERLWILDQLDPGTTTYTLGFGLRIHGAFSPETFARAAHAVVARHELLRSGIAAQDGVPHLRLHPDRQADLTFVDLSRGPRHDVERRRAAFVAEQVARPFDLSADPVLRIGVADLGDDVHQVVETMPHSFTDQWSYLKLNAELMEFYAAFLQDRTAHVPRLPVQFGDWAHWQREYFAGPDGARHRAFWREYLRGVPERLALPYDGNPDTSDRSGRHYNFILDQDVAAAFVDRAKQSSTTLATAMVAVYAALLYEETGQRDIVVGVPAVTRAAPASKDLVGFLLTNLPLRVRLPPAPTPHQILAAATQASLAVAEHRETPFGEIVEAIAPGRSATAYPLLQAMLVQLQLDDTGFFTMPGARVYSTAVPEGVSSMDLTTSVWQVDGSLHGRVEYRTALFAESTIARLVRRLLTLIRTFATDPDTPLTGRTAAPPSAPPASLQAGRNRAGRNQAGRNPAAPAPAAPSPGSERIAAVWCAVLGKESAGEDEVFFEAGGTSVLAVRLAHRLRSEGFPATVRDVFTRPGLGQLTQTLLGRGETARAEAAPAEAARAEAAPAEAARAEAAPAEAAQAETAPAEAAQTEAAQTEVAPGAGAAPDVGPLGVEQEMLLALRLDRVESFAHSYALRSAEPLDAERLRAAAAAVVRAHPTLTSVYPTEPAATGGRVARHGTDWHWSVAAPDTAPEDLLGAQRAAFDAAAGPLFAVGLIPGQPDTVVLSACHLVVDGMSWGIVAADLARAYRGQEPAGEAAGYLEHAAALRALDPAPHAAYWRAQLDGVGPLSWALDGPNVRGGEREFEVRVASGGRREAVEAHVVTALGRALRPLAQGGRVTVSLIGLGREPLAAPPGWDPARAVGYYSTPYPLLLPVGGAPDDDLARVGAALRAVPDGGKSFGLLRCAADPALRASVAGPLPRVVVNYVGALSDPAAAGGDLFATAAEWAASGNEKAERDVDVDVSVGVRDGQLICRWLYHPDAVDTRAVRDAAARMAEELAGLLRAPGHEDGAGGTGTAEGTGGKRVSGVPGQVGVGEDVLERLFERLTRAHGEQGGTA